MVTATTTKGIDKLAALFRQIGEAQQAIATLEQSRLQTQGKLDSLKPTLTPSTPAKNTEREALRVELVSIQAKLDALNTQLSEQRSALQSACLSYFETGEAWYENTVLEYYSQTVSDLQAERSHHVGTLEEGVYDARITAAQSYAHASGGERDRFKQGGIWTRELADAKITTKPKTVQELADIARELHPILTSRHDTISKQLGGN